MTTANIPVNLESLRGLWHDLMQPWYRLGRWAPIAALMPQPHVLVLQADGEASVWRHDRRLAGATAADAKSRFVAVELPEDIVLRRRFTYPQLPPAELRAAVELEVRASSPFEPSELVWGHVSRPLAGNRLDVEAVSSSRRLVAAQLEARSARIPAGVSPEVWGRTADGSPIIVEGYGEARRRSQANKGHWVVIALVASALLLATAIAVTPSVQLKLRGLQGVRTYLAAHDQAAPLLRQREALALVASDAQAVRAIMADHIDPLMALDFLTQLVPDDTWLQRVQIAGSKVTLNGITNDTAALMDALGRHPDVRDVRSPQPVARLPGNAKERFQVELELSPRAIRPFAVASAAAASAARVPATISRAVP